MPSENMQIHPSVLIVWDHANQEAYRSNCTNIEPAHFFIGALSFIDGLYATQTLETATIDDDQSEFQVLSEKCRGNLKLSAEEVTRLRRKLQLAIRVDYGKAPIGLLHRSESSRLLFSEAMNIALEMGEETLSLEHLTTILQNIFPSNPDDIQKAVQENIHPQKTPTIKKSTELSDNGSNNEFALLGRDLSQLARDGKLREVVGREQEILRIIQILLRTTKRNILLIGEAGVGKTAIVEGLAQYLLSSKIPSDLQQTKIIQVNVSDLVAGTMYRGSMEGRLKTLIDTIERNPGLLLFLDEIHLVMRSGSVEGSSMDIANILKPALTRETFPCIGATTTAEYEKYIANDKAFSRRFHVIRVDEPDRNHTFEICKSWSNKITEKTGVIITSEAIFSAIDLSNGFIPTRRQPDKTIDLLEDAAAYIRLKSMDSNFRNTKRVVDEGLIRTLLEERIDITTESIFPEPDTITACLKSLYFGQEGAIGQISGALTELRKNKHSSQSGKPVFLFLGPERSGINEYAEIFAQSVFPKSDKVLVIDLADYDNDQDITRLRGVPPGFVGYDQDSPLVSHAQRVPQGAILFLNAQRASKIVLEFLTQVIDDMKYVDARNRSIDLTNQLIILTWNSSTQMEEMRVSRELIRQCEWVIEFIEIDIKELSTYFDELFVSLTTSLKEKGINEVIIDESSRMNVILQLAEDNVEKESYKDDFDQSLVQSINAFMKENQNINSLTIKWIGNGIEITGS